MTRRMRLVVAGTCALIAALLCVAYGQSVQAEAEQVRAEALERYGGEVVTLVVASEGLEAGDVVDRLNVTEQDWLADLVPEGAILSLDDVLGAEITVPVAAGAPLTSLNFRDDEDAVEVPSGCVAVTVSVTQNLGLPSATAAGTRLAAYEVEDSGVSLISDDLLVLRSTMDTSVGSRGEVTLAVGAESVASVLAASAEGACAWPSRRTTPGTCPWARARRPRGWTPWSPRRTRTVTRRPRKRTARRAWRMRRSRGRSTRHERLAGSL